MIRRMKLLLSQSHRNDPKRRDTEQELVASLLMQHRIEVILVEDLAHLEGDSTDALCIQGIRGDILVVAWHQAVSCIECLRRMGVMGKFDGDPAPTSKLPIALPAGQYDAMQRRIICLDLTDIDDPSSARQQILTLLREGEQDGKRISSAQSMIPVKENTSPRNEPIKVMPKRKREPISTDHLDQLLDEIDGFNL